jgi:hypothetical protein
MARDYFESVSPPASLGRRSASWLLEGLIVTMALAIAGILVFQPRIGAEPPRSVDDALRNELSFVRRQIELYAQQHSGVAPGYPGGSVAAAPTEQVLIDQLTRPTSAGGAVGETYDDTYQFGPYMPSIPVNPINGRSEVLVLRDAAAMPEPADMIFKAEEYGWVYEPGSRTFKVWGGGRDSRGVLYSSY